MNIPEFPEALSFFPKDRASFCARFLLKRLDNPDCKMYSIDLAGYGTMQLPEKDVFCLAGFSEKIFDLMKFFEEDKDALINAVKSVEL